jgi:eukaryotic-like serine/threonine-protein kinase
MNARDAAKPETPEVGDGDPTLPPPEDSGTFEMTPSVDAFERMLVVLAENTADPAGSANAPANVATLTQSPNTVVTVPPAPEAPPGYVIEKELGRGGMGVVYLARQRGLNRDVALKMILAGAHASSQDMVRFLAEAEAVAQLRHPNVVQVHEVGSHHGRPYMALEFCDGGALDRKFAGNPLKPDEAAKLLATLARAVHVAHENGIVHRDLKPQNVLLMADGTPKVTDFGLAKRAGSGSDLTASGAILGTPSYMAPEQAEGKGKQVGPAADVYALGAILYEALTGRPPFRAATPLDTVLQVVREEPVAPRQLNPQVPADLETIALKCLQKDPSRRYLSAEALADDLERWSMGEPITARPVSVAERAIKWVKRNKAVAGGAAGIAAALLIGTTLATWQAIRASAEASRADREVQETGREKIRAENNAAEALKQEGIARANEDAARHEEQRAVKALADLKAERGQSADFRYASRINRAYAEWQSLNSNYARTALAEAPPDRRGWEWSFLERLFERTSVPLQGHSAMVLSVSLSPDGSRAFTIGLDHTVRIWDARTGAQSRSFNLQAHRVAASPDGRRIAVAAGRTVHLFDPEAGREPQAVALDDVPCGLSFVHGGKDLVVVTLDGVVTVRDPISGAERSRCPKRLELDRLTRQLINAGVCVTISTDGRRIGQGGIDGKARVWDAASGELLLKGEQSANLVGEVAFSPDGKFLAAPSADGTIGIWDIGSSQLIRVLRGHRSAVWAVAYSPDGTRLASGSKDLTARLWNPATGEPLITFVGHRSEVRAVAFSHDGTRLITASPDGTAQVWDPADRVIVAEHVRVFAEKRKVSPFRQTGSPEHLTFYSHAAPTMSVACSPDGRLVATSAGSDDEARHQITVWDVDARREVMKLPGPKARGHALVFTPDGRRLIAGLCTLDKQIAHVSAFDVPSGRVAWTWDSPVPGDVSVAVSENGKRIAVITQTQGDNVLAIIEAENGKEVCRRPFKGLHVGPAFVADDRWIAIADAAAGTIKILDAETGEPIREWKASNAGLTALAAGPNGRVACAEARAAIQIWDATTGEKIETLDGHAGIVLQMAFGPERRLASVGNDFTARVWNTDTGYELLTFRDHNDVPIGVAWSRDGSRLATACLDGAVRVWQGPAPDTESSAEKWPVVFADRFDRSEIGPRWKAITGEWTIHDGALHGMQAPNTYGKTAFNVALSDLEAIDLPNQADVRFRFRLSRSMVMAIMLAEQAGTRLSYSPILAGACKLPGSPMAFVLQITNPTGKPEDMKPINLGAPVKFAMEAGRWYSVRMLREPERLRVWADGELVLTQRIPDVDLPRFRWQGAWSEKGDAIEFADLEIRAPTDAVRQLALRKRTRTLFDELKVKSEVRRQLALDEKLKPDELALIDRTLAGLVEDAAALQEKSWQVVRQSGATAEDYRLALVRAEAAAKSDPENPEMLGTVGLAQYRCGQAKKAVATLAKAVERAREEFGAAWPSQPAGLALAYHQLGNRAAARSAAEQVQLLMFSDRWANDPVAKILLGEVEDALGDDAKPSAFWNDVVKRVALAEIAGWLHHDLDAYLALYTADATFRYGRGDEPGTYDAVFDRKQLEAARRIEFRSVVALHLSMSFEDVTLTANGEAATLSWRLTVQGDYGYDSFVCRYQLARVNGKWLVRSARSQPVARLQSGAREVLTAEEWSRRDKAADELKGDTAAKIAALKRASRWREAFRLAVETTESDKDNAGLWTERGDLAFMLGDLPASLAAFARAEKIDPDVRLPWYMSRARTEFHGHRASIGGAAFIANGDTIVSVGADSQVRIWDGKSGEERRRIDAGEPLAGLAVSRDGSVVAAGGNDVHIFDSATGKLVATGKGHSDIIYRLHFDADGTRLVSASADGTARIWNAKTGRQMVRFNGHGKPVLGADFSPDGRSVVSCGDDNVARLWNAENGTETRVFKDHKQGLKRAVFSPNGKTLVTVSVDRSVKLWDVESGDLLRTLDGHENIVDGAAFSADGKLLATGDWAGVVRIWDAQTGAKRLTIAGYPGEVWSVAFRPDGRALLVAGSAHAIVYDLQPIDGDARKP